MHITKILVINVLIFIVGIVTIEMIFGGWFDSRRLNRLNLFRDCKLIFNVSNLYEDANPTFVLYSRDKYGLRGNYSAIEDIDILTVGGSTTDQRYIRDGETWQDVLQHLFKQAGTPLSIVNAGIDGQSTYGHIKNFKWWFPNIRGLSPKYILYYVGTNDFHKATETPFDNILINKGENSALCYLVRTLHGTYEALVVKGIGHNAIDFSKELWTRDALQKKYDFMDERLNEYRKRLQILASLTYQFGAKPIFVSQPSRQYRITPDGLRGSSRVSSYDEYQINGVDYYFMLMKLNNITKGVALETGSLFIDLSGYTGWADDDFYDFSHMTPKGAEKVGKLLYKHLQQMF